MQSASVWWAICFLLAGKSCISALDPYFWHLTDFHLDPSYWSTQDSCNEILPEDELGQFGDYQCDAPYELIQAAMKGIKDQGREPEFILYTGDTAPHPRDRSILSEEYVYSLIENVTRLINESFPYEKKVVAIGNHDFFPVNQLPGTTNSQYEALTQLWAPWFGHDPAILQTFRKGAYYTQMLNAEKKLRVVVTNNNLYLTSNKATEGQDDPAGQYAWINQVLTQAQADGDHVHLVAHVPLGMMPVEGNPRWIREADNIRFNQIVRQYADVIKGFYSSHEHLDSFRLYYNELKEPVAALFVAPSVTPWIARYGENGTLRGNAHNPGIRKISFDQYNGHLTDIEQYSLDLPKANTNGQASWPRLYGFRALYGLNNVTAPSLHALVQSFKPFANTDFHNWYDMRVLDTRHPNNDPCDCQCKYSSICMMEEVEFDAFDKCEAAITCGVNRNCLSYLALLLCFLLRKMLDL